MEMIHFHLHFIRHFVNRAPSLYKVCIHFCGENENGVDGMRRALSRQLK